MDPTQTTASKPATADVTLDGIPFSDWLRDTARARGLERGTKSATASAIAEVIWGPLGPVGTDRQRTVLRWLDGGRADLVSLAACWHALAGPLDRMAYQRLLGALAALQPAQRHPAPTVVGPPKGTAGYGHAESTVETDNEEAALEEAAARAGIPADALRAAIRAQSGG